jgi:hypothetical protein
MPSLAVAAGVPAGLPSQSPAGPQATGGNITVGTPLPVAVTAARGGAGALVPLLTPFAATPPPPPPPPPPAGGGPRGDVDGQGATSAFKPSFPAAAAVGMCKLLAAATAAAAAGSNGGVGGGNVAPGGTASRAAVGVMGASLMQLAPRDSGAGAVAPRSPTHRAGTVAHVAGNAVRLVVVSHPQQLLCMLPMQGNQQL